MTALKNGQRKKMFIAYVCMMQTYLTLMSLWTYMVTVYTFRNMHHQKQLIQKKLKRFNLALAAIRAVTGLNRDAIFIKTRARQTGTTQYTKQSTASKRFIVQEGKAKILVNLTDYLDTGLFLDHRQMRLRIAQEARGKHFLNLYSYTSTASLHAALGGAASTTSVDLSNTYLNWSKENFVLNGLTVDHADEQHMFFASDCFEWLKEGHEQYDLIFIDPPTFSNSKNSMVHSMYNVTTSHLLNVQ